MNRRIALKCLGLISGYLNKKQTKKGRVSLDPRSCKLVCIFAPFDTEVTLPFELGAEDGLDPWHLGAPLRWYRIMGNLRGK